MRILSSVFSAETRPKPLIQFEYYGEFENLYPKLSGKHHEVGGRVLMEKIRRQKIS
jgi:hypothetical protein